MAFVQLRRFRHKKTSPPMRDDANPRRTPLPSLRTMYQRLHTMSPFVRSKSNKNIVVNPTIVDLVADPLAKVGDKLHHVAPGTYEDVVERFQAARRDVLEGHKNVAIEESVPHVGLVKDLLPSMGQAPTTATTTWTLNDILNEIQVEKKLLQQNKHVLWAQAEQQVQSVVASAGQPPQLDACEAALEGAGVGADLIAAIVKNSVTFAQVPAVHQLLSAHPEIEAVIQTVQRHYVAAADGQRADRNMVRLEAGKEHNDLGRRPITPDNVPVAATSRLYDVPLSLFKGLTRTSPRRSGDKQRDLLDMLTALANQVVDEKVDEIKLSLVEASNASHALYTAITFIVLSAMFGALSLFLLSLWFTQFLNVYLSLSYLVALITASGSAIFLGVLFAYVGLRIVKNTMKSLQTILLSPQPARSSHARRPPSEAMAASDSAAPRGTRSFAVRRPMDKLTSLLAKKGRSPVRAPVVTNNEVAASMPTLPETVRHHVHASDDVTIAEMHHRPCRRMDQIPEEKSHGECDATWHETSCPPPPINERAEAHAATCRAAPVVLQVRRSSGHPSLLISVENRVAEASVDVRQVDVEVLGNATSGAAPDARKQHGTTISTQCPSRRRHGPMVRPAKRRHRRCDRSRCSAFSHRCRAWRASRQRKNVACDGWKRLTWSEHSFARRHFPPWRNAAVVTTHSRHDCVTTVGEKASMSKAAAARRWQGRLTGVPSATAAPTSQPGPHLAARTAAIAFVRRIMDQAVATGPLPRCTHDAAGKTATMQDSNDAHAT
ncbi:hypothetical protein H310_13643 [Aphanomyces invadans]|uniref:Transmembrane protein n=1 Tax=Aphanomyces invadans TaxID=157072 RepID=A0A024TE02_9STRA|nr:hypothetical protein H310_13643 [Aphanomyces invadans]ETV91811.1 hypothetical protein H310_13643 [Aphanomyces invadans]|eukprot:XP_008879448.1 hypothetical protein H310_13643 [Aphanomyces invadans]